MTYNLSFIAVTMVIEIQTRMQLDGFKMKMFKHAGITLYGDGGTPEKQ